MLKKKDDHFILAIYKITDYIIPMTPLALLVAFLVFVVSYVILDWGLKRVQPLAEIAPTLAVVGAALITYLFSISGIVR